MTKVIDAVPYPWPYDGEIVAGRLALVIAGDQRAWIDRSVGAAGVATTIETVAGAFRSAGALVVHVRHGGAAAGRRPCALPPGAGTAPWRVATACADGDLVVDAAGVDGFFGGSLDRDLRARSVTHLVFAGFGAEAAVDSTVRSANDRGYECLTLTDAVAPFDTKLGRHALASVTMSGGIFGAIATSDQLLSALATPSLQEAL